MRTVAFFFLFCLQLPCTFKSCLARDFLNAGQNITGTTSVLVSGGQRFVLGFFSPAGNPTETYLGIWYNQSQSFSSEPPPTVVWVANRDKPILNSHNLGVFQIADDGNLVVKVKDGTSSISYYWSSELEGSSSRNRTVKLMDSGNLVLFQNDQNMWQSFQHPTDTFLPGMKMETNMELTSWRGDSDPGTGKFTFKIMSQTEEDNPPYIILNNSKLYWESSRENRDLNPDYQFDVVAYFLNNFSRSSNIQGTVMSHMNYENTRLLMNSTGEVQFLTRDSFQGDYWSVYWNAPQSFCDSYNACGKFSTCNHNNMAAPCKCLPGFNQVSKSDSNEYCARKSSACGEGIRFLNLVMVKVGLNPDMYPTAADESDCKNKCIQMCPKCQAYSYSVPKDTTRLDLTFSNCSIWTHDLITLQEGDTDPNVGRNLSVRVDISDLEATPRSCEPCGTNIVPYPLSTGPNCGDPSYFTFSCNSSTGELSFIPTTTSGGYKVVSIDADSRKFVIQVSSVDSYCSVQRRNDKTLQIHFPFNVANECLTEDELEVTWLPPPEPLCNESEDCKGWTHSTCQQIQNVKRCLCNSNYRWDNASLNCVIHEAVTIPGSTEPKGSKGNSKSRKSLIIEVTLGSVVILACAIVSAYLCRSKITYKKDKDKIQRNRGRFYDSERHVKDLMEVEGLEEKDHEGIDVPYFDFESIQIATDNFSDANKLGRGGYGPVYKGKLQDGEVVAVKRLSSVSSQGLIEFKNEVVLIAKLQHRNLVRLRGYCIKGDEKILLYDGYMSPEYALDGIFSTKSDVFSFGVVVLEIISGKRNTGFYQSSKVPSLLGYAWKLWTENKLIDLMEMNLAESCNENQFIRCAHVALLCVQDEPSERPSMSSVVTLLDSETSTLPTPKQPTFFASRGQHTFSSIKSTEIINMQFESTTHYQECRWTKDFLSSGQNITGTTSVLSSANHKFVLGFFSLPGSPTPSYLGIWYNQTQYPSKLPTVVWVANRDNPVTGSSNYGVFQFSQDGNLVVTDSSGVTYWSSKLEGPNSSASITPTDTFLPGMKMDADLKLVSWSSDNDPKRGSYIFMMDPTEDAPYIILKNYQRYWQRGNHLISGSVFHSVVYLLNNFSSTTTDAAHEEHSRTNNDDGYENTRLVIKSNGELQFLDWNHSKSDWMVRWKAPHSFCDVHNACGPYTSCNVKNHDRCKCLAGFKQSGGTGCSRRSGKASCGVRSIFLELVKMKSTGIPDEMVAAESKRECMEICRHRCPNCQAYSYDASATKNHSHRDVSTCWLWARKDLNTLEQCYHVDLDEQDDCRNISVRLDISDIAPTPRSCEPCGTNMVPYPLRTAPNCGDPMYFNFTCNNSTGTLIFSTTSSGTHLVTNMDVDSRTFVIKVDPSSTYCGHERFISDSNKTLQIQFPYKVTNACLAQDEVQVTWLPPPEPICTDSVGCEGWKHSRCKRTRNEKRCICDANYHWDGVSLQCIEGSEGISKSQIALVLGVTFSIVVVLASAITFVLWKRKIIPRKGKNKRYREHLKDWKLGEQDNEGIEVPYFDFESILAATENFSDTNKLGQGGYGPVYKGKLQSGEVVAIKRLSHVSSQGLEEFKNEVVLIAKLQHRNLVRLRGYCIHENEKILLYEYMHNKSLDSLIFDPAKSPLVDWKMRFDIVLGIARGMLYLHQDSRLRVIHRDLKTSNILLDEEMQPIISDFGLAKIVGGKETEANTERVVGTYGYMSPEYAMDGLFSTKSDVFSFGVVVLEIISGKKNRGFYQSNEFSSLMGYVYMETIDRG
ncbi:hypothetical protein PIB30_060183 [Stylosanthes scabra]|uniref:Uncharacterized protein n=1 Tax=Stylosanthes scabra TaxID=79078 RepID=A0ABU6TMK9_9FABA|nr:hypothetical protein [Stylosanthes scabra]